MSNTYTVTDSRYCVDTVKFEGELNGKRQCYKYPMPAVVVDMIVLSKCCKFVHLVQRSNNTEPAEFRLKWAVPGGFICPAETGLTSARREFKEETGIDAPEDGVKFLCVADKIGRDPRQRTISLVYWGTADMDPNTQAISPIDTNEISEHKWVEVQPILDEQVSLAFDHTELVKLAVQTMLEQ